MIKRALKVLPLFCILSLAACEQSSPQQEAAEAPRAASPDAWRATLDGAGGGVVKYRPRGLATNLPYTQGQIVGPGDTLSVGANASVTLRIEPGGGEILVDQLSALTLRDDGPGLTLSRGHAVIVSPQIAQDATKPTITTPTGQVTLTGTKVSVSASPTEGRVAVSQGEVVVMGENAKELRAGFGQEVVMRRDVPAIVVQDPDVARSFAWAEAVQELDDVAMPQLERGMGKLVARKPYSEQEEPLELRDHRVQVSVQGMMAYTEITEEFHNPGGENLEGLYRFPLPADAQISKLSLLVGDTWMEGQFLENARAERIWRSITTEPRVVPRDPALLKWKQGNQFELRIFPIPPRSSRKIKIGYVQKLKPTGDGYRYTYPMPVDRSGQSQATHFGFDATIKGLDPQHNVTMSHYAGKITAEDQSASVTFEQDEFRPKGDLDLKFILPSTRQAMRSYLYSDPKKPKEDAFLAVSLRPQFESAASDRGRDFVVILDNSYGRKGAAMTIQRALAARLVHEMDPRDRVRVIACTERCTSIQGTRFLHADAALAQDLKTELSGLSAHGSTYAIEAIRSAAMILTQREDSSRDAHIMYMTDGVVNAGPAHPSSLERATRDLLATLHPEVSLISFGGDEDLANLEAIALGASASIVTLSPGESMSSGALNVLRHHYSSSLKQLAVQWPVGIEQVYPAALPHVLPGEEVTLVARVKPGVVTDSLVLRGVHQGETKEMTYPLELDTTQHVKGNAFVPRLWAKHRIDALELGSGDHKKEIVKLSQKFGILTRHTSLIALESERMMREFNVSHQRHTDWLGGEAPESEDQEQDAAKTTAKKRPKTRRSRPAKSSKRMAKAESLDDVFAGESQLRDASKKADSKRRTMPRRPYKKRCRTTYYHALDGVSPASSYAKKRAQRAQDKLERDTTNRTAYMDAIRRTMKLDEPGRGYAERTIESWLETNDMDPEALVLKGQVALNRGDLKEAKKWLFSTPEAAARAPWLLERVQRASLALNDNAMACAYAQALADTKTKRDENLDVLRCGASSVWSDLFDTPPPTSSTAEERAPKLRGDLIVHASWEGDDDVHIVLVEPNGRLLSLFSQRQKVSVARTSQQETLVLPAFRQGSYDIRLVSANAASSSPTKTRLTITSEGKKNTQEILLTQASEEVAQITRKSRKSCY